MVPGRGAEPRAPTPEERIARNPLAKYPDQYSPDALKSLANPARSHGTPHTHVASVASHRHTLGYGDAIPRVGWQLEPSVFALADEKDEEAKKKAGDCKPKITEDRVLQILFFDKSDKAIDPDENPDGYGTETRKYWPKASDYETSAPDGSPTNKVSVEPKREPMSEEAREAGVFAIYSFKVVIETPRTCSNGKKVVDKHTKHILLVFIMIPSRGQWAEALIKYLTSKKMFAGIEGWEGRSPRDENVDAQAIYIGHNSGEADMPWPAIWWKAGFDSLNCLSWACYGASGPHHHVYEELYWHVGEKGELPDTNQPREGGFGMHLPLTPGAKEATKRVHDSKLVRDAQREGVAKAAESWNNRADGMKSTGVGDKTPAKFIRPEASSKSPNTESGK